MDSKLSKFYSSTLMSETHSVLQYITKEMTARYGSVSYPVIKLREALDVLILERIALEDEEKYFLAGESAAMADFDAQIDGLAEQENANE